jgi:hypothetical protein
MKPEAPSMKAPKRKIASDVRLSGLLNLRRSTRAPKQSRERSEKPAACTSGRATNSENAATSPK